MRLPFNQPNNKTCGQTCLAIMTDQTVEYVIDWLNTDSGAFAEDCIIYLAHHGIYLGAYATVSEGEHFIVEDNDFEFQIGWPITGRPALLAVKSERFLGKEHWVFWDGEKIFDPSPLSPKCREISEYKIVDYFPLIVTEKVLERFPIILSADKKA